MRKSVFIVIVVLSMGLTCTKAQQTQPSEVKTTWGLKAEANMSNFYLSGIPDIKSKLNIGFTAGGFVNVDFTKRFALQGALLFTNKTSDFELNGQFEKYSYWGIEVPIYAVVKWDLPGRGRLYAGAGPYTEFGLSAHLKGKEGKRNLYDNAAMKDNNTGFGLMLGYEFPSRIQINAGYKVSVTNIIDANSSQAVLLPSAVTLGIGYRFGKQK